MKRVLILCILLSIYANCKNSKEDEALAILERAKALEQKGLEIDTSDSKGLWLSKLADWLLG